jgi:hypothetical protein
MFVGRRVKNNGRTMLHKQSSHRVLVGDVFHDKIQLAFVSIDLMIQTLEFLFHLENAELRLIQQHDAARSKRQQLATNFRADATGGSGDKDNSIGQDAANAIQI